MTSPITCDEMLKCLSKIPSVANHEDFILIVKTYQQNKNYIEPNINGIESYLEYVNVVDTITKLYGKYCT